MEMVNNCEDRFNLSIYIKVETDYSSSFISDFLGEVPTSFCEAGKPIARGSALAPEHNVWVSEIEYPKIDNLYNSIEDFFNKKHRIIERLDELKKYGTVIMRLSIVSLYAQIGFDFQPKDLLLIQKLNIPLEISIFSFGGCDSE